MPAPQGSALKRKKPNLPSTKGSRAHASAAAGAGGAKAFKTKSTPAPKGGKGKERKEFEGEVEPEDPRDKKRERPEEGWKAHKLKKREDKFRKRDEESDGSGYEEVAPAGDGDTYAGLDQTGYSSSDGSFSGGGGGDEDDSESDVDIFNSLAGPSSSKAAGSSSAAAKGKGPASASIEPLDDSDEDDDYILQMMEKSNVAAGKDVVKKAVGKKGDNGKGVKEATGGGSFQSMGLLPHLLKSIMKKYKTPTPIQRQAIPSLLAQPPRDIVAMSRTGSGKTLAYIAPLIQRLQGRHSTTFGARGVVLCPSRELALQVLKVGKEMARGFRGGGGHAGDGDDDSRGDSLRWGLVVGGEGLDEQFDMVASNPDVIIATPGRLLHLIVEMNLDLRSVQYIVFDEADRLFEMGFEIQLQEILARLPPTRQTLLFSATLPKNLVEFAKAGLSNPKLVRLDAESKISEDLQMSFLSVKATEKEAALLSLLRDVIQVPLRDPDEEVVETSEDDDSDDERGGNRGRGGFRGRGGRGRGRGGSKSNYTRPSKYPQMAPHQTLIFTATKHHVDYLATLLTATGYSVSHIYGSLDQSARKQQLERFRRGKTSILVVTDVAARGIDVPILENVVNYDFPTGARVFVHRVGRTARAGRKGSAYSFVTSTELPFFLDLQLFLGKSLVDVHTARASASSSTAKSQLFLGTIPRDTVDSDMEYISTSLTQQCNSLPVLKAVVKKGQAMYERSNGKASQESYRRAKDMSKDPTWGLAGSIGEEAALHPCFAAVAGTDADGVPSKAQEDMALARAKLLASVNSFRPTETIFEVGARGKNAAFQLMQERRRTLSRVATKTAINKAAEKADIFGGISEGEGEVEMGDTENVDMAAADDSDLDEAFIDYKKKPKAAAAEGAYKDPEFYMSHYQSNAEHDTKGYSMRDGASFAEQAKGVTVDLAGDDGIVARVQRASQITWDRKNKKFVKGDGTGADNKKMLRTESGARLPASFKSGRFDEWKAKNKKSLPRVGDAEPEMYGRGASGNRGPDGRSYRHTKITEAKPLDPKSNSYERKLRQIEGKKRAAAESAGITDAPPPNRKGGKAGVGGKAGRNVGAVKTEIRSADQIRKQRDIAAKRKEKNARPSKKGGSKGKGRK